MPSPASPCRPAASPRSSSPGTDPTSSLWFAQDWRPQIVLAWGERYDSPLWESRRDGYAYVCEHYACQAPADTPETLRAQL